MRVDRVKEGCLRKRTSEQLSPPKPASHWHWPTTHAPWPEQLLEQKEKAVTVEQSL